MKLPFHKQLVLNLMTPLNQYIQLPIMKWIASGSSEIAAVAQPVPGEYVQPEGFVTPLVLMAAQKAVMQSAEDYPREFQGVLNACMESIGGSPIGGGLPMMFASLIAKGYQPDECLVRISANMVVLGMYLERGDRGMQLQPETEGNA